jgi:hypothetical protein
VVTALAASFYSTWERWFIDGREDQRVTQQLTQAYRQAWESGDEDDRYAALNFVFDRRDPEGFDLVLRALGSTDARIAGHAGAIVLGLILEGFDLGPTIRAELRDFGARYPEWDAFSIGALRILESRETEDE